MMNRLYFVIANLVFALTNAQHIGIGTKSFDDSEELKVVSTNKGVLISNIDIPNINNASLVISPAIFSITFGGKNPTSSCANIADDEGKLNATVFLNQPYQF